MGQTQDRSVCRFTLRALYPAKSSKTEHRIRCWENCVSPLNTARLQFLDTVNVEIVAGQHSKTLNAVLCNVTRDLAIPKIASLNLPRYLDNTTQAYILSHGKTKQLRLCIQII
jgi:hypothetical protein